jgi:hypothetical protein
MPGEQPPAPPQIQYRTITMRAPDDGAAGVEGHGWQLFRYTDQNR